MGTRVSYPAEVKMKAIEMRLAGIPVKQVMDELNIKNKSQLLTWMRWYKAGEMHRFHRSVGKQYTYGKGPEYDSEEARDRYYVLAFWSINDVSFKYNESL